MPTEIYFSMFGDNYLTVKSMFTSLKMFPFLKRTPQFYQDIVRLYKSKVIQYDDFNNFIKKQLSWYDNIYLLHGRA